MGRANPSAELILHVLSGWVLQVLEHDIPFFYSYGKSRWGSNPRPHCWSSHVLPSTPLWGSRQKMFHNKCYYQYSSFCVLNSFFRHKVPTTSHLGRHIGVLRCGWSKSPQGFSYAHIAEGGGPGHQCYHCSHKDVYGRLCDMRPFFLWPRLGVLSILALMYYL